MRKLNHHRYYEIKNTYQQQNVVSNIIKHENKIQAQADRFNDILKKSPSVAIKNKVKINDGMIKPNYNLKYDQS